MAKAFVYWNFNKKVFSVKYRGRVIAHAARILVVDAEFKVSEAGRQRVLESYQKNVHAGIVCELADLYCYTHGCERTDSRLTWTAFADFLAQRTRDDGIPVRYNPYHCGNFIVAYSHNPIKRAEVVYGCRNLLDNQAMLYAENFS